MLGVIRVACAVKMRMFTPQAGFEHLKDLLRPGGHLISVDILECRALDTGHVLFIVGAQGVDFFAK